MAVRLPCSLIDRKSTRLNSSHLEISYAVFCLKKKQERDHVDGTTKLAVCHWHAGLLTNESAPRTSLSHQIVLRRELDVGGCCFFFFFLMMRRPPRSTLFPHTTPFV